MKMYQEIIEWTWPTTRHRRWNLRVRRLNNISFGAVFTLKTDVLSIVHSPARSSFNLPQVKRFGHLKKATTHKLGHEWVCRSAVIAFIERKRSTSAKVNVSRVKSATQLALIGQNLGFWWRKPTNNVLTFKMDFVQKSNPQSFLIMPKAKFDIEN